MSDFTDHLKNYMEENKITPAELARELNMERSTVFRYIKGIRIPSDESIVKRIADALRMAIPDKKILMEEYDRLNLGDQVVNSYKYVRDMFQNLKNMNRKFSTEISECFFKSDMLSANENIYLRSKREIQMCISSLFSWFVREQTEYNTLHLLMQPVYYPVQEALLSMFEGTEKRVEQIVCLEQRFSKSYENLDVFRNILPLCFGNMSYEVRYYYEFMTHHINELSWMPNVIIAGSCVLQFDYEMECGIFIRDDNYLYAIRYQYERLKNHTESFLIQETDMAVNFQIAEKEDENIDSADRIEENRMVALCREPYLGICISSDIYQKYLYSSLEKDTFVSFMESQNGNWNGMIYYGDRKEKIFSCFELDGIRHFMDTGIISEFPVSCNHPFPLSVRRLILRRMLRLMQDEIVIYCILKESIDIPENICFYWGGKNDRHLSMNLIRNSRTSRIMIIDNGICQVFKQFLEYLEKKEILYSKKDSLKILMEMEKEYI